MLYNQIKQNIYLILLIIIVYKIFKALKNTLET